MKDKIKEMYESGHAIRRIASLLKLENDYVKDIVEQNNFKLVKEIFYEEKITHIIELYKGGVSAKQLGIKYSIDKRRIQKWVKSEGILRNISESIRVTTFDENKFDIIDTPSKAYWLGFFYADAYNCGITNTFSIALKESDKGHLEKLCDFINLPKEKIKPPSEDEEHPACAVKIYSKHICEKMTELGCMQAKSFIIKFPEWLNESLQSHFIRGMSDGDGSIKFGLRSGDWKWNLVSTKECCQSISDIFEKNVGFPIHFEDISETNNNTYCLDASGNQKLSKIFKYLYKDSTDENRLTRKYEKYLGFLNNLSEIKNHIKTKKAKIPDNIIAEILLGLESGESPVELSKRYDLHVRTIRSIKYNGSRVE